LALLIFGFGVDGGPPLSPSRVMVNLIATLAAVRSLETGLLEFARVLELTPAHISSKLSSQRRWQESP